MGKLPTMRWSGRMVPGDKGVLVKQMIADIPDIRLHMPLPDVVTTYFIGPADGPVKIGYAKRLAFRLRDLQLANAYPLHVLASIDGPPSLEREYHRRFAACRLHGEWFERSPEILAEIARLTPISSQREEVA